MEDRRPQATRHILMQVHGVALSPADGEMQKTFVQAQRSPSQLSRLEASHGDLHRSNQRRTEANVVDAEADVVESLLTLRTFASPSSGSERALQYAPHASGPPTRSASGGDSQSIGLRQEPNAGPGLLRQAACDAASGHRFGSSTRPNSGTLHEVGTITSTSPRQNNSNGKKRKPAATPSGIEDEADAAEAVAATNGRLAPIGAADAAVAAAVSADKATRQLQQLQQQLSAITAADIVVLQGLGGLQVAPAAAASAAAASAAAGTPEDSAWHHAMTAPATSTTPANINSMRVPPLPLLAIAGGSGGSGAPPSAKRPHVGSRADTAPLPPPSQSPPPAAGPAAAAAVAAAAAAAAPGMLHTDGSNGASGSARSAGGGGGGGGGQETSSRTTAEHSGGPEGSGGSGAGSGGRRRSGSGGGGEASQSRSASEGAGPLADRPATDVQGARVGRAGSSGGGGGGAGSVAGAAAAAGAVARGGRGEGGREAARMQGGRGGGAAQGGARGAAAGGIGDTAAVAEELRSAAAGQDMGSSSTGVGSIMSLIHMLASQQQQQQQQPPQVLRLQGQQVQGEQLEQSWQPEESPPQQQQELQQQQGKKHAQGGRKQPEQQHPQPRPQQGRRAPEGQANPQQQGRGVQQQLRDEGQQQADEDARMAGSRVAEGELAYYPGELSPRSLYGGMPEEPANTTTPAATSGFGLPLGRPLDGALPTHHRPQQHSPRHPAHHCPQAQLPQQQQLQLQHGLALEYPSQQQDYQPHPHPHPQPYDDYLSRRHGWAGDIHRSQPQRRNHPSRTAQHPHRPPHVQPHVHPGHIGPPLQQEPTAHLYHRYAHGDPRLGRHGDPRFARESDPRVIPVSEAASYHPEPSPELPRLPVSVETGSRGLLRDQATARGFHGHGRGSVGRRDGTTSPRRQASYSPRAVHSASAFAADGSAGGGDPMQVDTHPPPAPPRRTLSTDNMMSDARAFLDATANHQRQQPLPDAIGVLRFASEVQPPPYYPDDIAAAAADAAAATDANVRQYQQQQQLTNIAIPASEDRDADRAFTSFAVIERKLQRQEERLLFELQQVQVLRKLLQVKQMKQMVLDAMRCKEAAAAAVAAGNNAGLDGSHAGSMEAAYAAAAAAEAEREYYDDLPPAAEDAAATAATAAAAAGLTGVAMEAAREQGHSYAAHELPVDPVLLRHPRQLQRSPVRRTPPPQPLAQPWHQQTQRRATGASRGFGLKEEEPPAAAAAAPAAPAHVEKRPEEDRGRSAGEGAAAAGAAREGVTGSAAAVSASGTAGLIAGDMAEGSGGQGRLLTFLARLTSPQPGPAARQPSPQQRAQQERPGGIEEDDGMAEMVAGVPVLHRSCNNNAASGGGGGDSAASGPEGDQRQQRLERQVVQQEGYEGGGDQANCNRVATVSAEKETYQGTEAGGVSGVWQQQQSQRQQRSGGGVVYGDVGASASGSAPVGADELSGEGEAASLYRLRLLQAIIMQQQQQQQPRQPPQQQERHPMRLQQQSQRQQSPQSQGQEQGQLPRDQLPPGQLGPQPQQPPQQQESRPHEKERSSDANGGVQGDGDDASGGGGRGAAMACD